MPSPMPRRGLTSPLSVMVRRIRAITIRKQRVARRGKSDARLAQWITSSERLSGSPPGKSPAGEPDSLSDEVIHWASRASLFPRLATLCFLMVIALILRTITDNGLVNPLLGMGLGMGYAAALMVAGWYQYRRHSSLAPVFVACGAILMSSIVVE